MGKSGFGCSVAPLNSFGLDGLAPVLRRVCEGHLLFSSIHSAQALLQRVQQEFRSSAGHKDTCVMKLII